MSASLLLPDATRNQNSRCPAEGEIALSGHNKLR
jgi:hypothetical protein